jgi:hypothetical protein
MAMDLQDEARMPSIHAAGGFTKRCRAHRFIGFEQRASMASAILREKAITERRRTGGSDASRNPLRRGATSIRKCLNFVPFTMDSGLRWNDERKT